MSASLVGSEMCIRDRPPPSGTPLASPISTTFLKRALLCSPTSARKDRIGPLEGAARSLTGGAPP
eukprot:3411326-Alexandrium_andersonii.AAC.1